MVTWLLNVLDLLLVRLPECQLFLVNKLDTACFVKSGNSFRINRTATFKHLLAAPLRCHCQHTLSCLIKQQDRASAVHYSSMTIPHITRNLQYIRSENAGEVAHANTLHEQI